MSRSGERAPVASAMREERKVVTAVFADLSGSTALGERLDRERLELFHQTDRMAVADQVALIPLAYGRALSFVKPWVKGWWEFGKTSSSFADLIVESDSPRAGD